MLHAALVDVVWLDPAAYALIEIPQFQSTVADGGIAIRVDGDLWGSRSRPKLEHACSECRGCPKDR